jgi:hypothetical protein
VGLRNNSSKTLEGVSLRAKEGWFVANTIAVAHGIRELEPIIKTLDALDPDATDFTMLFGLSAEPIVTEPDGSIYSQKRQFVLEARARDTKTTTATFEFDPATVPHIKRIG